jgi:hypothetical protein
MSKFVGLVVVLLASVSPLTTAFSPVSRSRRAHTVTARMTETDKNIGFSQEVLAEAADALSSAGWAAPSSDADGELTSADPFVRSIDASIQREMGVGLDELLNPAKVRSFMHRS